MRIEVLGTGCAKCNTLETRAREAAEALGVAFELEKITSIAEIAKRGVLMTPGLAVDGKLITAGRLPSEAELREILRASATEEEPR